MSRHLHINLFIHGRGHHEASWRHPSASPLPLTDVRYYIDVAQKAEAGGFDSIFLADTLGVGDDVELYLAFDTPPSGLDLPALPEENDLPAAARWRAALNAAEPGGYLEVSWRKDDAA